MKHVLLNPNAFSVSGGQRSQKLTSLHGPALRSCGAMQASDRTRLVHSTTIALHTANQSHDARLQSRERNWDNRFGSTLTAKHFRHAHRTQSEYFDRPAYFDTWTQKLTRPATVDHSMLNKHRLGGAVCRARRKRAERRLQDWRRRQAQVQPPQWRRTKRKVPGNPNAGMNNGSVSAAITLYTTQRT